MRKAFVLFVLSVAFSAVALAQPFVPNTMLLNPNFPERETITFDYLSDGVNIPVEVQGGDARAVLMVYTSGKAEEIGFSRHGYRGWHWINKVDTSIYISPTIELNPGDNPTAIFWDFQDKDGNKTALAEEFNYFLFAYEHNTPKVPVMNRQYNGALMGVYYQVNIDVMGEGGVPRDAPLILSRNRRWVIGGDPADGGNYRTTSISPVQNVAIDKHDESYFYATYNHGDTNSKHVRRYQWVEGGTSILDLDWGIGDGETTGFTPIWEGIWGAYTGALEHAGTAADMDYIYTAGNSRGAPMNFFHILDYDGDIVEIFDLSDIYIEDMNPPEGFGLAVSGGPNSIRMFDEFSSTKINLNHHGWCWRVAVDPIRGLENPDDFLLWVNGNGDYFTDNFTPEIQEDPLAQWRCNTVSSAPYTYQMTSDANGVGLIHTFGIGMATFGLYGPDGTGAGYHTLYGESGDRAKYATNFVKYDTQWDGLYTDANSTHPPQALDPEAPENDPSGAWYTPANSFAGKLVHNVTSVEEKAPVGFSVAQNTPNPFNPTTDISFTIPAKGLVTVDIYNVAGQKVQTLVNELMDSGTHRVTWDASSVAGGVYFYTVTSGNFSRTMKMTLVK